MAARTRFGLRWIGTLAPRFRIVRHARLSVTFEVTSMMRATRIVISVVRCFALAFIVCSNAKVPSPRMAKTRKKKLTMMTLTMKASLIRTLKSRATDLTFGTSEIVLLRAQLSILGMVVMTVLVMVVMLVLDLMLNVIVPTGMNGRLGPTVRVTVAKALRLMHVAGTVPNRVFCSRFMMAILALVVLRAIMLLTVILFLLTVVLLGVLGSCLEDRLEGLFGLLGRNLNIRMLVELFVSIVEAARALTFVVDVILLMFVIRVIILGVTWSVVTPLWVKLVHMSLLA